MFSKKKRNSCSTPASPLPRLQQLAQLEADLFNILGQRNVAVDPAADIFTRLEQLYLGSLQASPLGRETLEKCLRVLGQCDSPARVRFLYLCAHEMRVTGAAVDELEPVLLEAFHCALALRHKVELGFKAALAFCQISTHAAEVDKILSSLVVALQQELGYHPHSKPKSRPSPSGSLHADTKTIYLGAKLAHKSQADHKNHSYGRLQKL